MIPTYPPRTSPPRLARAVRRLALLCAGLLLHLPLQAQEAQRVIVDLSRGTLRGTLPFDEIVELTGAAPAELRKITPLRVVIRDPSADCAKDSAKLDTAGVTWTRTGAPSGSASLPNAPLKADTFALFIDPLAPDRNYRFCLRTQSRFSDSAFAAFRTRVVSKVDSALKAQTPTSGQMSPLTASGLDSLYEAFHLSLPKLAPNQRIVIPEGSLFALDRATVRTKVQDGLADLLPNRTQQELHKARNFRTPLLRRLDAITVLEKNTVLLRKRLNTLASLQGASLRRVLEAVHPADTLIGISAPSFASALRTTRLLAAPVPGLYAHVADGTTVLSDSGIAIPETITLLTSIWTSTEANARLERLRQTRQKLDEFRALITALAVRPRFRGKAHVSDSMVRQVDAVRGTLLFVTEKMADLATANAERERLIIAAVNELTVHQDEQVVLRGSTVEVEFETRTKRYVSAELGVAYAFGLGQAAPYAGLTVFPGGVNKRVPQSLSDPLRSQLGLMVGLTVTSVAQENETEDLFGSSALLLGGTWRFFDVFRASGGAMLVRQLDPSTLSDDRPVRATPFASLSFDLDIRSIVGGIADILSGK